MLVAKESARARVHGGDQHEPCGERDGSGRASDRHASLFKRLTQHLEGASIELGHLVEEQHAVVRQRDLTRPRNGAATNERHIRDRVMRRAKRPLTEKADARWQCASHGMDRRALQRFVERERRQDRSQPPRHHRLSGTGRALQQEVVPTSSCDFERTTREQLSSHVCKITVSRVARFSGGS
jgi:hypothetical protein